MHASSHGFSSWSMDVLFFNNEAMYGGAILITDGSAIMWSGQANFTSNTPLSDGSTVGTKAFESGLSSMIFGNDEESFLDINGTPPSSPTTRAKPTAVPWRWCNH